jgi:hypothetical protein
MLNVAYGVTLTLCSTEGTQRLQFPTETKRYPIKNRRRCIGLAYYECTNPFTGVLLIVMTMLN